MPIPQPAERSQKSNDFNNYAIPQIPPPTGDYGLRNIRRLPPRGFARHGRSVIKADGGRKALNDDRPADRSEKASKRGRGMGTRDIIMSSGIRKVVTRNADVSSFQAQP